jgi:peroxiredoxin Q/BCP
MTKLAVGDTAPAFTLPDATGTDISLADYAGQRVVVYFYPAALTPGCTKEAVDFSDSAEAFSAKGLTVIGISPDPVPKVARFTAEAELSGLVLLSDTEKSTLEAYGAFGDKMLHGKTVQGVIRSTFVIAVDDAGAGTVELAQYNVRATGHVARLRRELGLDAILG